MDDAAFDAIYGAWQPLGRHEARDLLVGFDRPWWICGGWAIELAGGTPRHHHDLDLLILIDDLPYLRQHLAGWHLFLNHDGEMRPLADGDPLPDDFRQIWIRRDPDGPWRLDLALADTHQGRWVCKRDPTLTLPVGDIGLRTADGIPYLRPELALLFKAKLNRSQDRADFADLRPKLDPAARDRLIRHLRHVQPESPWLTLAQQ